MRPEYEEIAASMHHRLTITAPDGRTIQRTVAGMPSEAQHQAAQWRIAGGRVKIDYAPIPDSLDPRILDLQIEHDENRVEVSYRRWGQEYEAEYWIPSRGGYVRRLVPGRPGTLSPQIWWPGDGGGQSAVEASPNNLGAVIREWLAARGVVAQDHLPAPTIQDILGAGLEYGGAK